MHPAIISSIEEDDYCITFRAADTQDRVVRTLDKDDLIDKAVLDIPSLSTDKLKTGSRVAVYPVQNCGYLLPGTVRKVINAYLIQVTLDTGPIKDINCDHVKIIPNSFIKKPTFDSKIDLEAFKNMTANNSLINKKKPNILLGYDYVDTDKPDLQNSWEAALSRKSSKRPEKKVEPMKPIVPERLPPAPVTSEIKTQPYLPIPQSLNKPTPSLGQQKPLVSILNPPMAPPLLPPSSLAPSLLPISTSAPTILPIPTLAQPLLLPSSMAPPLLPLSSSASVILPLPTLAQPLLPPSSVTPLSLPPSALAPTVLPPYSMAPPLSIPVKSTEIKALLETKPEIQTEKKSKPKAPKLSRSKSRESYEEMKRAVKETVSSLVSEVTAEEKLRQSLIIGALKKWSPKKEAARAKSTKATVKKKKKIKDGERTSSVESSGSDDVTMELLSICKESNINTPNKVSEAEKLAWQQSRPPVPPPTSLQPPASITASTSKSEVSNESSTQNIPSNPDPRKETLKPERSLDDIVRETMMALAKPSAENVSLQEKAITPDTEQDKEIEKDPIMEKKIEPNNDVQNNDLAVVSDATVEQVKSEENISNSKDTNDLKCETVSEPFREVTSKPTEVNSEPMNELEVTVDPVQNEITAENATENKEVHKIDEKKEQPDSTEKVIEPDMVLENAKEEITEDETVVENNLESPHDILEDKTHTNDIAVESENKESVNESPAEKPSKFVQVEAEINEIKESKEESNLDTKETESKTTLIAILDDKLVSSSKESEEKDTNISIPTAEESTKIDVNISISPVEDPSKKDVNISISTAEEPIRKDVYEFDEDQDISPSEVVIKKKKIELAKSIVNSEIKEPTDIKKDFEKSVDDISSSEDTKSVTESVHFETLTNTDENPETVEVKNEINSKSLVNGDSASSTDNLENCVNDLISSKTEEPTKPSTTEPVKVVPKKKPNNNDKPKPVIKKKPTSFTELKLKKKKLEELRKISELKETKYETPTNIDKADTNAEKNETEKLSEKVGESVTKSDEKSTENFVKPIAKPVISEIKQTKNNNEPKNDSKSNKSEKPIDEITVKKDKAVLARKALVKRIKEMKKKKVESNNIPSENGKIEILSENLTKNECKDTSKHEEKPAKKDELSSKPTQNSVEKSDKATEKPSKMVEKSPKPIEKSVKPTETDSDKTSVKVTSLTPGKTVKKSPPKKKKPKAGLQPGHVDENTFYYRDPEFPDNWFIKVTKRSGGTRQKDHYFFTPCRTMLRSMLQITRFIKGAIPSQPSKKKFPIDYEDMPFKQDLSKADQEMTNNFELNFYKLINKKKTKENPVLTNGIEEHSPGDIVEENDITEAIAIEEASEDASEQKMTDDNCFKIPNEENIRMLRSRRSGSSKKDLPLLTNSEETENKGDDEKADIENKEVNEKEDLTVNNIENGEKVTKNIKSLDDSTTETKPVDDNNKKDKKVVNDVLKIDSSPHSPIKKKLRSNDILSKKKLRSGKVTKSPKKKLLNFRNKKLIRPAVEKLNFDIDKLSSNKTKKDKSHKNSGENAAANNVQTQGDVNVQENKPEEAQEETTANSKDITDNDAQTNKKSASNKRPASPDDPNCTKQPLTKKLKREDSPSKPFINRGPACKRKHSLTSSESEGEEDICSTDNDIHTDIDNDNNDISTNDPAVHKCAASLVKVFKQGLMEATCGHCFETGCYTPESIEIDIPGSIIIMECGVCSWTTVRRISITNKLI